VNVISNTAHAHKFGAEVAAECGQIWMHARPHVGVEGWFAILGAKDDVKDYLT